MYLWLVSDILCIYEDRVKEKEKEKEGEGEKQREMDKGKSMRYYYIEDWGFQYMIL